jgi:hypothetical protein
MRFFVFFLGALLIAAGATSIGFGIDIVQVERGWTEVISGAMILAAGAVIVALGCVVAKLDQVLRATERALRSPADQGVAVAPAASANVETAGVEPAGLRGTPPVAREWSAPPVVAMAEVESVAVHAQSASPGTGQVLPGEPWAHGGEEAGAASARSEPRVEADHTPAATAAAEIGAPDEMPEASAETNFEWLERALSDTDKPDRSDVRPDRQDRRQDERQDNSPDNGHPEEMRQAGMRPEVPQPRDGGRREESFSARDPARPASSTKETADQQKDIVLRPLPPAPEPELRRTGPDEPRDHAGDFGSLAPTAAEPAILGRYQANGNSYVMFSDGSIEAVTQTGVYRFGSMAELKAFIEAQT